MTRVLIDIRSVTKAYGGLRPLRIERLTITEGQRTALVGLDQPMAEAFVNLVTGSSLPDSGEVELFGRSTASIQNSDEWLTLVDRLGLVSERAVLLDSLSVVQNLAMPYSLDVDPLPPELGESAAALAREVGLAEREWQQPVGAIDALAQMRVRLARAIALGPEALILEHPTARLAAEATGEFGRSLRGLADRRGIAALTITADRGFASSAANDVLTIEPSTGKLRPWRSWWRS